MKSFVGRILLALLIGLAAWLSLQLFGYSRLQTQVNAKVAKLREDGLPTKIVDLRRADADKSEAFGVLVRLTTTLSAHDKLMLAASADSNSPEQQKARTASIKKFIDRHPELVAQLREAAKLPIGNSWSDYSLLASRFVESSLNHMGRYTQPVRVLRDDAILKLNQGDVDESALDALAIMRWSEHAAAEAGLSYYLKSQAMKATGIGIAVKAIVDPGLSPSVRTKLVEQIRNQDAAARWSHAIATERVIGLSMMDDWPATTRYLPFFVEEKIRYLDLMEEYDAFAAEPWGVNRASSRNTSGSLTASVAPALKNAYLSFRRSQAQDRAILVLDAWVRAGKPMPVDVRSLDIEPSMIVDPYSGDPIRMAVTGNFVIFYFVGSNLADDGGNLADDIDVGVIALVK